MENKGQKECKHEFRDISNHWFHWNTGEVMCVGVCINCGLKKDVLYSKTINYKRTKQKL